MISQNQQAFIDLLNSSEEPGQGGPAGGPAEGQAGGPGGAGGFQIQVTPEEKAAIDRVNTFCLSSRSCILKSFARIYICKFFK